MPTADPNHVISINVTQFPQNLLIPGIDNSVSFQVSNQSTKEEHFKFVFEGENLEIDVKPVEFLEEVLFKPGETKAIKLNLNPTNSGFGKLTVNAYWMRIVEYIVNVQKIREKIPLSKINQILKKKQFLPSIKDDGFDVKNFVITSSKSEVKKIEKQITEISTSTNEAQNNNKSANKSKREIEEKTKILAKSYLSIGEFYKALENSLKLTNEKEKTELYYNLIRANATLNLESTLQAIRDLNDINKKNLIINNIAVDYVKIDPEQVNKILSLIEDDPIKQNAVLEVISVSLEKNASLALKFAELIKDDIVKIKVLYNLAKNLHSNNQSQPILSIINQIIQTSLSSNRIDLSDQNFKNPNYEYFKDAVCILAELDSPAAADKLIQGLSLEELKNKVAKDLYNEIYKMVEEKKTKVEPIGEFSQFYLLNMYTSQITNEVKEFSLIGGNASNNILMGNYNYNIALISLFSFNFSIFPIIDRVYSELSYNSKKSFAYYIFPSISEHNQDELKIIQATLKRFFKPESIRNRVTIYNLDFIPYLGKPSVILSSITEDVSGIQSRIVKTFGDRVDVMVDNDLFKGGKSVENLSSIFYGNNFNIVNMVLSYEFINDYEIFKTFIQSIM
ncbi:MAG: hypothetical protein EAX91_10115 [Candidatus Lokiarchaeota archaeon]|nr:hypothetical protein [Candidatus Lokiarchaeota archaeon]